MILPAMNLTRRTFLASSLAASALPAQTTRRPNILFCIADDWGSQRVRDGAGAASPQTTIKKRIELKTG